VVFYFDAIVWFSTLYVSTLFRKFCFSVCTGISQVLKMTWHVELVVDILWLFNIYFCFTTTYYTDMEEVKVWKKIAKRYFFDVFFIDFITTVPAIVTFESVP